MFEARSLHHGYNPPNGLCRSLLGDGAMLKVPRDAAAKSLLVMEASVYGFCVGAPWIVIYAP